MKRYKHFSLPKILIIVNESGARLGASQVSPTFVTLNEGKNVFVPMLSLKNITDYFECETKR